MSTWDTPRTRPVKEALRDLLMDGRWHGHQEVIKRMLDAGDLNNRTCSNMLRELVKDWSLEARGSYRPGGQYASDNRAYRATTPEGLNPVRDTVASLDRDLKRARNRKEHLNKLLADTAAKVTELNEEITMLEEIRQAFLESDE